MIFFLAQWSDDVRINLLPCLCQKGLGMTVRLVTGMQAESTAVYIPRFWNWIIEEMLEASQETMEISF